MHRHVFVFGGISIFLLVTACAPELQTTGGTGGTDADGGVGGTGGGGGAPACTSDADCSNNECRTGGACTNGMCRWAAVGMAGAPIGEQVYGDCKQRVCDASGNITQVDDPADVYDWGDPCYKDGCNAWMAPEPNVGVICITKWGSAGLCDINLRCRECVGDAECSGTICDVAFGKCLATTCKNGILDGNETDVDCGGTCAPCPVGMTCGTAKDCDGDSPCGGNPKICIAPSCTDGFKNGDETDLNCGGSCATKCGQAKGCHLPTDCAAGLSCKSGTCQP